MSGRRHEAIVAFGPPAGEDWRRLNRRDRAALLRDEVRLQVEQMLDDLRRAGLAEEVEVVDGTAAQSIPAGAVLVRATYRALEMIRKAKGVVAVADADTPLETYPLSA